VFVHVGLPKTGTTHVQMSFAANRRLLARQGLLYPHAPRHPQHFLPVLDFLQMRFGAIGPAEVAGRWETLQKAVDAWSGRALVSHELLAGASTDQVGRLVEEFPTRPVHVLITVRDLSRMLPAVWQERAKNRVVESWQEFREAVALGPDAEQPHAFWLLHDAGKVVGVWREHVPDDRIHVVTLPPSGSDEGALLDRFTSVLGVDSTGFTVPSAAANASIGGLELAVLREVNVVARRRLSRREYQALVKRFLVPRVLAEREGDLVKVTVPESDRSWITAYTDRVCAMLSEGAIDIVGDLDDLTPRSFAAVDPDDPAQSGDFPDDDVTHAMAEVIVDLLQRSDLNHGGVAQPTARSGPDQSRARRLLDRLLDRLRRR
jgi:hypothetical protein